MYYIELSQVEGDFLVVSKIENAVVQGKALIWNCRRMKRLFGFAIALTMLVPWASSAPAASKAAAASAGAQAASSQIETQIQELQTQAEILQATVENMEETLANATIVSGYLDTEYIIDERKGKNDGFRVHHFSLFLEKKFERDWSVFSELEFEDAPYLESTGKTGEFFANQGKILLEQMYTDYQPSQALTFRAGRFLTPAGIWNINHYPPFVTTQSRPQHIRLIFPQYLDGLQVHGAVNAADLLIGYMAYASNGQGNSGTGDGNNDKAFGGRLEISAPAALEVKAGFSALSDKLYGGEKKTSMGADLQVRMRWIKIQSEYAVGRMEPAGRPLYNAIGYYLQVQADVGKWTVFARHDFYNPDDSVASNGTTINTGGLNYHWTPTIVTKVEGNFYDGKAVEGSSGKAVWIMSVAVFF